MVILSKAELARAIDAMQSDGLLYFHEDKLRDIVDSFNAMTAALEAWIAWATDPHYGMGGPLFDRALDLTEAAGITTKETTC